MRGEDTYRDPEWLREKYHGQGLSQADMASLADCSQYTICKWMDEFGVEANGGPDHLGSGAASPAWKPHATFYHNEREEYGLCYEVVKSKTDYVKVHRLVAVAEYGFDSVVGKVVHHKNGIAWDNRPENLELMTNEEHSRRHGLEQFDGGPWRDEGTLREAAQAATPAELAEHWGCSKQTIYDWADKFGIPIRQTNTGDTAGGSA